MTAAPHILLINPWIHDFAAYDFWAKPLGLLVLAALLRQHGCTVSYIDCLDRFHPRAPATDPQRRCGRGPYLKTRLPKPAALPDVPRDRGHDHLVHGNIKDVFLYPLGKSFRRKLMG